MSDPVPISPTTGKPQKGPKNAVHGNKCEACNGTGKLNGVDCLPCKGKGRRQTPKCTNKQKEQRIEQLASVIGKTPLKKHEIRHFCANEWNLKWRQSDRYAACARELLLKVMQRPRGELQSEAVAWCDGVIRDPKASEFAKLRAFREKSQILGLYAPVGMRIADEQGNPLAATVVAPVINYICPDNHRATVQNGNGNGAAQNGNGANGKTETAVSERK